MKKELLILMAVTPAALMIPTTASAQNSNAVVVTSCGTPPGSYTSGANRQVTQDTNGNLCIAPGGGSGSSPTTPSYTVPVPGASPTSTPATSGQLAGTAIDLQAAAGAQIQITGLNADSLAITQGMAIIVSGVPTCTGATYVTATVLKNDLTTTAASALTGTSANGIYSVMQFGGCLKITRTGSADALAVTYRGTN